jgi:hypothetical protein
MAKDRLKVVGLARRSGPGSPCGIESVNYGLCVLIEGLHICRQNLSAVRMTEQLSDCEP